MDNNIIDKRTKGEWKFESHDPKISHYAGNIISELGKGSNNIMQIRTIDIILNNNGVEEAEANAAFICKAVNNYDEILENLKRLVDRLEENDFGHMSAVKRAKEAIKKAEQ